MLNIKLLDIPGYYGVYHGTDDVSGLDVIVSVHNINLGMALGGCRAVTYNSFEDHLNDALNLSKGMTYKNSLAGLNMGGGKTAINLHGKELTDDMLESLGEVLNVINQQDSIYTTAGDVGTSNDHLRKLGEFTDFVWGFEGTDSGFATAYGVYNAMLGALDFRVQNIEDQRVAITGFGKVGSRLGKFVADAGGHVIAADVNDIFPKNSFGHMEFPKNHGYGSVEMNHTYGTVFSPCALGGALSEKVVKGMYDGILVCGGANNQLASPEINEILAAKGIHYIPDYLANAGGVILIGSRGRGNPEIDWDTPVIKEKLENLKIVAKGILEEASESNLPTSVVADKIAEDRFMGVRNDMPRFVVG